MQSASVPCQGTHVLCQLDASDVSLCGGFEDVRLEVLSLLFQSFLKSVRFLNLIQRVADLVQ